MLSRRLPLLTAVLLSVPRLLTAQAFLEQFSYEGLGLAGIGVEVGGVASDRLTTEWSVGLRVDYGMFAPRVRLMFGASYFKGDLGQDEIDEFEQRLGGVVQDPTGDAVIDVGQITWANFETTLDLQYLFHTESRYTTYVGVGLGVHVRNSSGAAIEDTFVEDALDTVTAGVNGTLGIQIAVTDQVHFTTEVRGGLSGELRQASARAGFMYRLPSGPR